MRNCEPAISKIWTVGTSKQLNIPGSSTDKLYRKVRDEGPKDLQDITFFLTWAIFKKENKNLRGRYIRMEDLFPGLPLSVVSFMPFCT